MGNLNDSMNIEKLEKISKDNDINFSQAKRAFQNFQKLDQNNKESVSRDEFLQFIDQEIQSQELKQAFSEYLLQDEEKFIDFEKLLLVLNSFQKNHKQQKLKNEQSNKQKQ